MGYLAYSSDELDALASRRCSLGGFVRIATPTPARYWTGTGDFAVTDSAFDSDGTLYKAGGRLLTMPVFQTMFNGLAERLTISMSGVSQEMRDLAAVDAADIKGANVRLGIAILDEDWAQVGIVRWLRRLRVDVVSSNSRSTDRGRERVLEFSLGSLMTGRKVQGQGVYTSADQNSRPGSEDDRGLERMPLMANVVKRWPS